ncbi:hypothetical protein [Streptomyces sp. NPDC056983]|uniref:hypothetical protein n=1 Tax=Streptomyces sp. NPDC056983 TaxID=3345987 RepID=UPI0036369DA3
MHRSRPSRTAATSLLLGAALVGCADTDDSPPNSESASSASRTAAKYQDGAYKATGTYGNGPSHITVDLTLTDNRITQVHVSPHATDPTSLDYQKRFARAVPGIVTGKNIDDIELDHVAGSSGTPDGFNDALDQIKKQAD